MSVSMKDEPSNKAPFDLVSVRLIEYAIQTEAIDRDYLRAALG